MCVRSGQRVEVPLHRVRERGRRLPHPLHLRAHAGGQAALLHGARTRPVQQRRSEEDVILHNIHATIPLGGAGHGTDGYIFTVFAEKLEFSICRYDLTYLFN